MLGYDACRDVNSVRWPSPSLLALYIQWCIWNTLHGRIRDAQQGFIARRAGRMVIANRDYLPVAHNFLKMNDPCLQQMTLLLRRGARSALSAMVRSLLFPVAQAPHIKPFLMGFITGCLLFYPFHIPSCSSSASQIYVLHTILQVVRPFLGRSCHHVLQAALQVPFPCLGRSCPR